MTCIGFYGGTFDPVHRGHIAVAHAVLDQNQLAHLYVVPAYQPPFRPGTTAAFADRLAMARLAYADWPHLTVSDLEAKRAGISYTIDSIAALRQLHPHSELCLVVGADTAEEIETWREPERLARLVRMLVAPRPGYAVHLPQQWRFDMIHMEPIAVSATDIREAIRSGRPIDQWVPGAVADYIAKHRLYLPI